MSADLDVAMLQPGALPPVPVKCGADRFDNFIREYGIGYCCEWFGHEFDGEFAAFTVKELQARNRDVHAELVPTARAQLATETLNGAWQT